MNIKSNSCFKSSVKTLDSINLVLISNSSESALAALIAVAEKSTAVTFALFLPMINYLAQNDIADVTRIFLYITKPL